MNEARMFAMKAHDSGATGSVRFSQKGYIFDELHSCASTLNGNGIWMRHLPGLSAPLSELPEQMIAGATNFEIVKINCAQHHLWRAVDHEGEVLESYVTKMRDKLSALRFLKKAMKRYGLPRKIITDRLRSYGATLRDIGMTDRQEVGRHLNNRVENSHLPFRRRERAISRFRQMSNLQKFAATHASFHNHYNQERHINRISKFKSMRNAALSEWRELLAG